MGQALVDAKASVLLICLGAAGLEPERKGWFTENLTLAELSKTKLSMMWCHVGHLPPAWTDLPTISFDRLVEKLKTTDLIIPF
mgnify:CR=1 FL=1